uniref:Arsenite methyltransferase n=1 Tax=Mus musculus TaxID=10090 RepID=A0A494BBJ9_MOUSE
MPALKCQKTSSRTKFYGGNAWEALCTGRILPSLPKRLGSALHVWSLPISLLLKTRSSKGFLVTVALCLPHFASSNSLRQSQPKDAELFTMEESRDMKRN